MPGSKDVRRAPVHPWAVTPAEARVIQQRLRGAVIRRDCFTRVETVAGVDVGFPDRGATTRAAVAVLSYPGLELLESSVALRPTRFPYVPGLLSFREVPAVLEALQGLGTRPDVLLCDGQGIAHPRRFGVACHIGVLSALPTIGVAKSRLIGTHGPVPVERGGHVPLMDRGEQIGVVLRTRAGVRPVYVSVGHCVSLVTAIALVMACTTRYRLPETTRWADRIASARRPPR